MRPHKVWRLSYDVKQFLPTHGEFLFGQCHGALPFWTLCRRDRFPLRPNIPVDQAKMRPCGDSFILRTPQV